jgi:hypothetical protein
MVSVASRAQLQRVNDPAGFLVLLILSHPSIQTAYVVNDTRDWTIGSEAYIGLPFRFKLPQARAGESPRAMVEIDNVGRALTAELEKLPPGAALMCTIRIVSRATPTVTDFEFAAQLTGVSVTVPLVTAVIGNDDALRSPAVKVRYDPSTTPALFEG